MAVANDNTRKALAIANTKASEGKPLDRKEFAVVVQGFQEQIALALPMHLKKNAEKYARQALTLFSENPKLQQANPITILSALMKASALGLDLNPQLGQAYIIPYDNKKKVGADWVKVTEAQFQLGYRGCIALAYRSDRVKRIAADIVCANDTFKYSKGLDPVLEHVIAEGERGEMTHAYAVANFVNGGYAFEVWPVHQIVEHAKKFSKSYYKIDYNTKQQVVNPNSPWITHFESMSKKTMVMAIWKYLPLETELLLAGAQDETTVRDLSRLEDEHSIINIMPERDEVEALPAERPAPEPKATTKGKAVVMSDPEPGTENETDKPEEMGRMSDDMFILQTAVIDIMGDAGLGYNDKETATFFRNILKTPSDLPVPDIYSMTLEEISTVLTAAKEEFKKRKGR